ncbi:LacI family DNA-binding transcriptional regulator [Pararhizobium gei]|uniref:LacI family DNA-binding transcriptional regulator n=1 Tax=Pararhizobium gei TaxID=1395951 RepID=UPI0023DA23CE|nr:substrate-binding domain-containing protein [Rhizobium gei]
METRNKIQVAIEQLGYLPNALARNFRLGKTKLVLALVGALGDPFYGDVLAGVSYVARQRGYRIRIQEFTAGSLSHTDLNHIVTSREADGIIVLGGAAPFRRNAGEGESAANPAIVVCGETADPELLHYPRVQIDGFSAAREITLYLIGLGHRNIAFMRGEPGFSMIQDRETGYRAALEDAGIDIPDDWLADGNLIISDARRATRKLVNAKTLPTAIVCANDEMALGTISELQTMKFSVPGDISVVGFDNIRYGEVSNPQLTTVAQPAQSIGETGMYRLLKVMDNPLSEAGVVYLPHRVIIRQSAGIAPKSRSIR